MAVNRFFIPDGGLPAFLQSNLRFKVLDDSQRDELPIVCGISSAICSSRRRFVRTSSYLVRAARDSFGGAWMFHIIQVLLVVVGFVGEDKPVVNIGEGLKRPRTEESGDEAHLDFPEYDANHWISANFAYRGRPTDFRPIATDDSLADTFKGNGEEAFVWTRRAYSCVVRGLPPGIPSQSSDSLAAGDAVRAAGFKATLQAVESVIKKTATRRSMRVLAARMGKTQGPVDDFFVKEEERALSEASYGSMPGLVTPPASSASE
ncbi:hypothetical protein B0H13DRAFT_2345732 [Mycena leptocephala]|nr:hypothetical protein B0H13DRAFT_2345732 [Mycena leptocephala]